MKTIWWVALAAGSAAYSLVRQGKDVLPSFRVWLKCALICPGVCACLFPPLPDKKRRRAP